MQDTRYRIGETALEEQRKEIRIARQAQQKSAEALRKQSRTADFRAKIEALTAVITSYKSRVDALGPALTPQHRKEWHRLMTEAGRYELELSGLIAAYLKPNEEKAK